MRTQKISFSDQQILCVFPNVLSDLAQAISELHLDANSPVIVLIGGEIGKRQAEVTQRAIQTISKVAEDINAVVICGGTDMGVMDEIGKLRLRNHYKFPLVGVAPKESLAWPGGLCSTKFLWWGRKRRQLASHYSHFILVPGIQFGDESPWIVDAAAILSKGHQSVTILINGGEVSRMDIELSLKDSRPAITLSHGEHLADEFSRRTRRHKVPANAEQQIVDVVHGMLSAKDAALV